MDNITSTHKVHINEDEHHIFLLEFKRIIHTQSGPIEHPWTAEIVAEDKTHAWKQVRAMEGQIPDAIDFEVTGMLYGTIDFEDIGGGLKLEWADLPSLQPWFIYHQLDYLCEKGIHVNIDELLEYFEERERFEICARIKRKG